MKSEDLKSLNKQLNTGTKLLVPMTMGLLVFAFIFRDLDNNLFLASLFSLIVVLLIDYFIIVPKQYPKVWNIIKWAIIITIGFLTLTSSFL